MDALVRPPAVTAAGSAREYWEAHRVRAEGLAPIDAAAVGGVYADRLGWAFVAGYGEALRVLDPGLPAGGMAALCATEARGVHPRDLETAARREGAEWVVDGVKVFATLADQADVLLVVASAGSGEGGRNRLVVVRVPAKAPGVTLEASPREIPFAPEISHQVVRFSGVRVPESAALPGDGYEDALKPFRSIEDAHVFAAGLSYLCGVAGRFDWPASFRERAVTPVMALRALASSPSGLRTPESHVALGGALALGREVVEASEAFWDRAGAAERERWRRDRPLLEVAGKARAARLEAAWKRCAER
ncbi:MAG TPA: acyl-CoA dehydrogenase family protein [Myxococcaceae bacterium]|nr:acyl-CoA dehydrogenase family protein [Myxococcaceae bacterium]